jgi:hypothetical protein
MAAAILVSGGGQKLKIGGSNFSWRQRPKIKKWRQPSFQRRPLYNQRRRR